MGEELLYIRKVGKIVVIFFWHRWREKREACLARISEKFSAWYGVF